MEVLRLFFHEDAPVCSFFIEYHCYFLGHVSSWLQSLRNVRCFDCKVHILTFVTLTTQKRWQLWVLHATPQGYIVMAQPVFLQN